MGPELLIEAFISPFFRKSITYYYMYNLIITIIHLYFRLAVHTQHKLTNM